MQVIEETLCPTWDETLILDDIYVFGLRNDLVSSPQVVIVELFDYDTVVCISFLHSLPIF